jgi:hypothetical protein
MIESLVRSREEIAHVQSLPDHHKPIRHLWFSNDIAERGGRADPSQGQAGDPDDR